MDAWNGSTPLNPSLFSNIATIDTFLGESQNEIHYKLVPNPATTNQLLDFFSLCGDSSSYCERRSKKSPWMCDAKWLFYFVRLPFENERFICQPALIISYGVEEKNASCLIEKWFMLISHRMVMAVDCGVDVLLFLCGSLSSKVVYLILWMKSGIWNCLKM